MESRDRTFKSKAEGAGRRKSPDFGSAYHHAGQHDELLSFFDLSSYVTDRYPPLSGCADETLDPDTEHQSLRSSRSYPEAEEPIAIPASRSFELRGHANPDRYYIQRSQPSSCFASEHENIVQGIDPQVLSLSHSLQLQSTQTSQSPPTAPNRTVSRHPKDAVAFLNKQLSSRSDNPYFSEHEKTQFAAYTGLTVKQINNWLRHTLNRKVVSPYQNTRTIVPGGLPSPLCQSKENDPRIDYRNSDVPFNYTTLPAASPTTLECSSSPNLHVDDRTSPFDEDESNLECGTQSIGSYDEDAAKWWNTACLSPSAALSGISSTLDQETNRSWDEATPSSSTGLTNSDDNPAWSHPFTPGTLDETWPSVEAEASESPQYTVARQRRGLSRHGIPSRVQNLSNHDNLTSSDLSPSTQIQHFCTQCSILFTRKASLIRHTNTSTQHNQHTSHVKWICKPILYRNKCAICSLVETKCRCHELCFNKIHESDRTFKRADNLKQHFKHVHKVDFSGRSEILNTDLWKVDVTGRVLSNVSSPSLELRETPRYWGGQGSRGKGDSTG